MLNIGLTVTSQLIRKYKKYKNNDITENKSIFQNAAQDY